MSHSEIFQKIKEEIGEVDWFELRYLFAKGKVLKVDASLDLAEVSFAMAKNDQVQIEAWMNSSLICAVSDEDAKILFEEKKRVRFSAVSPWALVQF